MKMKMIRKIILQMIIMIMKMEWIFLSPPKIKIVVGIETMMNLSKKVETFGQTLKDLAFVFVVVEAEARGPGMRLAVSRALDQTVGAVAL